MHALIVTSIVTVLSVSYLASRGWAPQILSYLPEVLGIAAAAVVIVAGTRSRFAFVRPVYWLILGAFAIVIICGAVANRVEPGPIFAGLRMYMRALPFFLLPAVIVLEDRQLRNQLLIVLVISVIQLPIAAEQRMAVVARGGMTGDSTFGTLMNSGQFTLYLVCVASVVSGFLIRRMITGRMFGVLMVLLLVPTMLNEGKVVLVVLPMALCITFVLGARPGERMRNALVAVVAIGIFVAAFIPVYDYFIKPKWGYGIVEFFLMEGRVERYLDRGAQVGEYGVSAGKLGGFRIAVSEIARDPISLVFGFGIGSVTDSALGDQFTGKYFRLYGSFLHNSATTVVFELGLAGLALLVALYWVIFKDCLSVARTDQGMMGALAIGWTGVVATMSAGLFYHHIIDNRALGLLFWYLSGVIAAYRMHTEKNVRTARDVPTDLQNLPKTRSMLTRAGGHEGIVGKS